MALINCPECGKEVSSVAMSCPSCGHPIAEPNQPPTQTLPPKWNPGVAAVLSLVLPGAGQMYKGQVLNGLVWLVLVVIGYIFAIAPGIFLHLCCILGASMGNPRK